MKLTIGIKAYNEERRIADAIASALDAASAWGGEVILADSGSTDRTVEIARRFPVTIARLVDPSDRSPGAGAQLAFQGATGEYFYLLDGDMVLDREFIASGIGFLDTNPRYAGVGGIVVERNTANHQFRINQLAGERGGHRASDDVDRLDGGGLYRTSAIRSVGYFADRNLKAFEELELGIRLREAGWKLARFEVRAADHYGHQADSYQLLLRRMKSGYMSAVGQVVRGALGAAHGRRLVREFKHLWISALVICWWLLIVLCAFAPPLSLADRSAVVLLLVLTPLVLLLVRRRSLALALYSFVVWNVSGAGLIVGLFKARVSPTKPLRTSHVQKHG